MLIKINNIEREILIELLFKRRKRLMEFIITENGEKQLKYTLKLLQRLGVDIK
ncbi:MAG: hypothetical protein AABY22_32910 [Nanoarchaeota archaeon]